MLLRAIRAVARGEALLGASIASRVLEQFSEVPPKPVPRPPTSPSPLFGELTPRELEVLRLIAQGLRNREIAQRLVISEKTVGNHISNIFTKLQVANRVQAIIRAREAGLGQDKP
jgi:DNA-binding NarL/FixJ family response regulator